jgi:hypothetical protein
MPLWYVLSQMLYRVEELKPLFNLMLVWCLLLKHLTFPHAIDTYHFFYNFTRDIYL